jgi:hypothetical protein
MVDWQSDYGPRWTIATGDGRSSPERELTDVPVRGTLSWWHGEQEKGPGIPTPIGTK